MPDTDYCRNIIRHEEIGDLVFNSENSYDAGRSPQQEKIVPEENVYKLDIDFFKSPGSVSDLYRFKNVVAISVYLADSTDLESKIRFFDSIDLSAFKNLCAVRLLLFDQSSSGYLEKINFEGLFKNIHSLSYLEVNETAINNDQVLNHLPGRIHLLCFSTVYQPIKSSLDISRLKDLQVTKIKFTGSEYRFFIQERYGKPRLRYPAENPPSHELARYKKTDLSILDFASHLHSLEELDFSYAYIDTLPESVSNLTRLKTLRLVNCFIRYVPAGVSVLPSLETWWLYNNPILINAEYRVMCTFPRLVFENNGQISLPKLKNLYFFHTNILQFPDFKDISNLKNLIFIGNDSVTEFPGFVKNSEKTMQSLVWNHTACQTLPDYLDYFKLKNLNIDYNRLNSLNNVLNAAAYSTYFTFDFNEVNYENIRLYNTAIEEKRKRSGRVSVSTPQEETADSIYKLLAKNTLYNALKDKSHRDEGLRGYIHFNYYKPYFREEVLKGYYPEKEVDEFLLAIQLAKAANIDLGYHFSCTRCHTGWTLPSLNFEDYTAITDTCPAYPFSYYEVYDLNCENDTHLLQSNRKTLPYVMDNENYWDTRRLGTVREAGYEYMDQDVFNTIIKAKGLKVIRAESLQLDSIPECFYELKLDTIELNSLIAGMPFPKDIHFPVHTLSISRYGYAPPDVRYLHIRDLDADVQEEVYLPHLKVLAKSDHLNAAFPINYLIHSRSLDSVILYSGKVIFQGAYPEISLKYLNVGHIDQRLEGYLKDLGFNLAFVTSLGSINGFPDFHERTPIEQIEMHGTFYDLYIPVGVSELRRLKNVSLHNDMYTYTEGSDGYIDTMHVAHIEGLEAFFLNDSLESLELINIEVKQWPVTLKKTSHLKKLSIRFDDDFYELIDPAIQKKVLMTQLPVQLLKLNNLEELELHGDFKSVDLDLTQLPKLKTLVLKGVRNISPKLLKQLRDKGVNVVIKK